MSRMRIATCFLLMLLSGAVPAVAGSSKALVSGTFNPSEQCGQCHREIYAMWRRSMHSSSFSDPIFEASYSQAYLQTAGKASEVCLRCHAPVAVATGDLEMRDAGSREGITCDYCHSVVSVDLDRRENPLRIALDGVKRGPLHDAVSPSHDVARSPVHEASEFCGGCHEYVNPFGVAVMSTYSEWKSSRHAAAGKTCHACHMPLMPGNTVPAGMAPRRGTINLHDISGGHSTEQVRKAATVRILGVRRTAENAATVDVEVANVGSGHALPTGMPTRKLVMEVVLFCDGREIRRFEREYRKTIVDAEGRPILEDHRTLLEGRSILADTRLQPGERRTESFEAIDIPPGKLRVEVSLAYLYQASVLIPQRMSIEMAADRSP